MKGLVYGALMRHYKGGLYVYIAKVKHTDNPRTELIVYQCTKTHDLWARPVDQFYGKVSVGSDKGVEVNRFVYAGKLDEDGNIGIVAKTKDKV